MGFNLVVNCNQLLCNLLLLGFEEIKRDGVIVVRLKQLFTLAFQLILFPTQTVQLSIIFFPFLLYMSCQSWLYGSGH